MSRGIHVPVFVTSSPIHGFGLFAAAPVRTGALVTRWTPGVDMAFTRATLDALPRELRVFALHFGWEAPDGLRLVSFNASHFTNHSDNPNLRVSNDTRSSYARRDIAAGEELTEDYRELGAPVCECELDCPYCEEALT